MIQIRRIDEVKDKRMRNVKLVEIVDKKRIKIIFHNNQEVILTAKSEEYGYDEGIYFERDNV